MAVDAKEDRGATLSADEMTGVNSKVIPQVSGVTRDTLTHAVFIS
jgi:hypothetical protein